MWLWWRTDKVKQELHYICVNICLTFTRVRLHSMFQPLTVQCWSSVWWMGVQPQPRQSYCCLYPPGCSAGKKTKTQGGVLFNSHYSYLIQDSPTLYLQSSWVTGQKWKLVATVWDTNKKSLIISNATKTLKFLLAQITAISKRKAEDIEGDQHEQNFLRKIKR